MHSLAAALLVATALSAQLSVPRIGDLASQLTPADIARLEGVSGSERKPWLIVTRPGGRTPGPNATVYLEPTVVEPRLRRGEALKLTKRDGEWRADSSATWGWAWVPVAGRKFGDVVDEDDVNRPFDVFGEWTNEELVTLADFLRTAPQITKAGTVPAAGPGGATDRTETRSDETRVQPGSRIMQLVRERDLTLIYVQGRGVRNSGQSVSVERVNGEWLLRNVGWFIIG